MYVVAEFSEENSIETVPQEWISEGFDYCWWPPKDLMKAVSSRFSSNLILPDKETWQKCPVIVRFRSEDHRQCIEKASYLEDHTDIDSSSCTEQKKRKKKTKPRHHSDSEDDTHTPKRAYHLLQPPSPPTFPIPSKSMTPKSLFPEPLAESTPTRTPTTFRANTSSFHQNNYQTQTPPTINTNPQPLQESTPTYPPTTLSANTSSFLQNNYQSPMTFPSHQSNHPHPVFHTNNSPVFHPLPLQSQETLASQIQQPLSHIQPPQSISSFMQPLPSNTSSSATPDLFMRVIERMEVLSGKVDALQTQLDKFLMRGLANNEPAWPEDIPLPVVTSLQLEELNDYLKEDEKSKNVIAYLATVGGSDPGDLLRRIMARVMANTLALEYNCSGAKCKKCFNALAGLKRTICCAVRRIFKNASDKELDKFLGAWFAAARDRVGDRRRSRPTS